MAARTGGERRALQVLARVVSDSPFRAPELIDGVCAGTRDAFGLERVEWDAERLVAVPVDGKPPPEAAGLSVLNALGEAAAAVPDRAARGRRPRPRPPRRPPPAPEDRLCLHRVPRAAHAELGRPRDCRDAPGAR